MVQWNYARDPTAEAPRGLFHTLLLTICKRPEEKPLAPVQTEYARILADKAYVDEVLKSGAERASRLANRTVSKVYRKVGLLQLDK